MEHLQIWVLSGVLGLALVIVGFLSKNWFNTIAEKLEKIIDALNLINVSLTSHTKDIEYLKQEQARIHERLNAHGERLHELEKK